MRYLIRQKNFFVAILRFFFIRKSGSFVRSKIPEVAEKEIALKTIAYNIRKK